MKTFGQKTQAASQGQLFFMPLVTVCRICAEFLHENTWNCCKIEKKAVLLHIVIKNCGKTIYINKQKTKEKT